MKKLILNKIVWMDLVNPILIFLGIVIPATFGFLISLKTHKRALAKQKTDFESKQQELELQKKRLELEKARLMDANEDLCKQRSDADIKMNFFNQIFNLTSFNIISNAVNRMFDKTKADRFLILYAVNGKTDFNVVTVVFEQHKRKEFKINAIARYHNVQIDAPYQELLKQSGVKKVIELETSTMQEGILKDFYMEEQINHTLIRQLIRRPIDENNDVLVYSSIATHSNKPYTRLEKSFIKTQYEGTIIPNFKKTIDN